MDAAFVDLLGAKYEESGKRFDERPELLFLLRG